MRTYRLPIFAVVGLALLSVALLGTTPTVKGVTLFLDQQAYNGIATGSLPGCAAGVANGEGWTAFDSTTKTFKVCNGTSWASAGLDPASVAASILPSITDNFNIGSNTKRWSTVFALTLSDANTQVRLNWTNTQPIQYYGDSSDGAGAVAHKFHNLSAIAANNARYAAKFYRDNNTNNVANIDTNGNFRNGTTDFAAPMVHGTNGANAKDIEVGSGAMTGGELAVTFGTGFGTAPICNCTHVNTTNANGCNIKSGATPTTTTVTFAVTSGGTDVVHWNCVGAR